MSLVLFVFAVTFAAMLISAFIILLLHSVGILSFTENARQNTGNGGGPFGVILTMIAASTILGTALTVFFSKKALNPIRKVIEATHQVAKGSFNVQVNLTGIYELEELSHSFNTMTHELSSIETLRGDFVNNFSHEFKTPIVSIRGFAKLLKEGNLSEDEKQEYLNIIIAESERLATLSTNVLNLSKYEHIEIVPDKIQFRLDEQIRRAIVLTEPKWSAKKITLTIEMDEVVFEANEDLTQQIWLNLLENAIKFTPPQGHIIVRLAQVNEDIRFSIQDSGIGMSEETKTHIFDKFYQGDTSHTKEGYGLGLVIVKKITELCDGKIEVQSEPNQGSKFSVWFSK